MADQSPQVNQDLNNQNDNDELFWWSDDIFENSDLLQPINTEVDTTNQVIKSQNDLNNFSGEIQSNQWEDIQNTANEEDKQINEPEQHESRESDDFFDQPNKEQDTWDEHLTNLYDDQTEEKDTTPDDLWINDDIFNSSDSNQEYQEVPEIVDNIEETKEDNEFKEDVEQANEQHDVENVHETEGAEETSIDDDLQRDLEELKNIDDLGTFDDIYDDDEEEAEWDEPIENEEDKTVDEDNEYVDEKNNEEDNDTVTMDNKQEWIAQREDNEKEDDDTVNETANSDEDFEENEEVDDLWDDVVEEETPKTAEEQNESITVQDYEKYDPNLFKTDIQKKFGELQWKTEKIHESVGKDLDVWFDLLWWNDDRQKITYKILSGSDYVEIEKEELNKQDESKVTNMLQFVLDWDSLQTIVNDILLYDEIPDLQNDPTKKMQVMEKMNKFIFLLDEEYKKIQKYKKEKEERNAVKWIFRNF